MKHIFVTLLLLISTASICSQNTTIKNKIKNTINIFFKGMHNGDTLLIKKTISQNLKLQTTFVNKEGKNVLKTETKDAFLLAVSKKESSTVWFEKLLSMDIRIDGNLASVWAPYEFYLNNNFSHCGVNSFQLFNNNGNCINNIYYFPITVVVKKLK